MREVPGTRSSASVWSRLVRRSAGLALLVGIALLAADALATEFLPVQTPNIFEPASTPADKIRELSWLVLGICAAIFVVVGGLLTYTVVRFRHRPGDDDREPAQIYGSNQVEIAWTIVPMMIVLVLFLATARTILDLQRDELPKGWMEVIVTGHQWWWEIEYPEYGIVTANELHVPVSEGESPRPVFITLQSADVIHSFWLPRLAGKTDLVPNRRNHMWIEPWEPGLYVGQCAEYCGTQHANMLLRVYAHTPADFERWVANQREPAVEDPRVRRGHDLFLSTACINCHTVGGTVSDGTFGPDLTHLMSRDTIAAGAAPNDEASLRDWVADPDHIKPGARMPAMKLSDEEIDQVVAYLLTLK